MSGDRLKVSNAEHKYMRLLCLLFLSVKFYRFQCQGDRSHQKQMGERFQECEGQPTEQQPGAGSRRGEGSKGGECDGDMWLVKVVSCVLPSFSARFHLYLESNYINGCPIGEL